jgi:hypothetical protein
MDTDRRTAILQVLRDDGYVLVHRRADPSDPLAWGITARKGEYELVVEEYPVYKYPDRHRV